MVKRLILATLLAAGGTGVYVFGSGGIPSKSDATDSGDQSDGEWQVEYVDGEGNPIQQDARGTGRFKLTSKPFFKRLSGLSTHSTIRVGGVAGGSGFDNEGLKRTSGG
jgi:hypothetical protein